MFLRAGLLSLVLLLASRVLGLLRESVQAAAFGASGLADVVVLMLTLPDWLTGLAASGALAYVLLPAWARADADVDAMQRRMARVLWIVGSVTALAMAAAHRLLLDVLAPGAQAALGAAAWQALLWSAAAFPLALVAALGTTRLQHARDFVGMYGANLVVNGVLIAALAGLGAWAARVSAVTAIGIAGLALVAAMALRLVWLRGRAARLAVREAAVAAASAPGADVPDVAVPEMAVQEVAVPQAATRTVAWPRASTWAWAILAAGLPLALPFAARSIASAAGEGALVTFNYAWKLVELPLMLAIQLVATLAFPAIARALSADVTNDGAPRGGASHNELAATTESAHNESTAGGAAHKGSPDTEAIDAASGSGVHSTEAAGEAIRSAIALAWTLACCAVAVLAWAATPVASLLFGWGRMDFASVVLLADWGRLGSFSLLPQALIAVVSVVLAAQARMRWLVAAYAAALAVLLLAGRAGVVEGRHLMLLLNLLFAGIALVALACLGRKAFAWLPWPALASAGAALALVVLAAEWLPQGPRRTILAAALSALAVAAAAWWASADLRRALRR